jgi:hypothetical protein
MRSRGRRMRAGFPRAASRATLRAMSSDQPRSRADKPPAAKQRSPRRASPSSPAATPRTGTARATFVQPRAAAKGDAARRARALALLAQIERRRPRIVDEFHEIGTALGELLEARLHEALGHASFAGLLEARPVIALTTAKKLIAIAENLGRDAAVRLGRERAYALVAYAAATPDSDSAATLAARDGEIGGQRLSTLSKREIEAATRSARGRGRANSPAEKARRAALQDVKRVVKAWNVGAVDVDLRGPRIIVSLTVEQATRLG